MTLAFENVDSKLLDDVSVADERVDKSLVEILILYSISKLKVGQDFEVNFRLGLWL